MLRNKVREARFVWSNILKWVWNWDFYINTRFVLRLNGAKQLGLEHWGKKPKRVWSPRADPPPLLLWSWSQIQWVFFYAFPKHNISLSHQICGVLGLFTQFVIHRFIQFQEKGGRGKIYMVTYIEISMKLRLLSYYKVCFRA